MSIINITILFIIVFSQTSLNISAEINVNQNGIVVKPTTNKSKSKLIFYRNNDQVKEESIIVYSNYLTVRKKQNKTSSLINLKPKIAFLEHDKGTNKKRSRKSVKVDDLPRRIASQNDVTDLHNHRHISYTIPCHNTEIYPSITYLIPPTKEPSLFNWNGRYDANLNSINSKTNIKQPSYVNKDKKLFLNNMDNRFQPYKIIYFKEGSLSNKNKEIERKLKTFTPLLNSHNIYSKLLQSYLINSGNVNLGISNMGHHLRNYDSVMNPKQETFHNVNKKIINSNLKLPSNIVSIQNTQGIKYDLVAPKLNNVQFFNEILQKEITKPEIEEINRNKLTTNLYNKKLMYYMNLQELIPPLLEPLLKKVNKNRTLFNINKHLIDPNIYFKSSNTNDEIILNDSEDTTDIDSISTLPKSEILNNSTLPPPPLPPSPPPPPPIPKPSKLTNPTLTPSSSKIPVVQIPSIPDEPQKQTIPFNRPTPPLPPPLNTHRPAVFAPIVLPVGTSADNYNEGVFTEDVINLSDSEEVIKHGPTTFSKHVIKSNNDKDLVEHAYSYLSPDNVPVRVVLYKIKEKYI